MLEWENLYSEIRNIPAPQVTKEYLKESRNESRARLEPILKNGLTEDGFSKIAQANSDSMPTDKLRIFNQAIEPEYEIKCKQAFVYTTKIPSDGLRHKYSLKSQGDDWRIATVHSS